MFVQVEDELQMVMGMVREKVRKWWIMEMEVRLMLDLVEEDLPNCSVHLVLAVLKANWTFDDISSQCIRTRRSHRVLQMEGTCA